MNQANLKLQKEGERLKEPPKRKNIDNSESFIPPKKNLKLKPKSKTSAQKQDIDLQEVDVPNGFFIMPPFFINRLLIWVVNAINIKNKIEISGLISLFYPKEGENISFLEKQVQNIMSQRKAQRCKIQQPQTFQQYTELMGLQGETPLDFFKKVLSEQFNMDGIFRFVRLTEAKLKPSISSDQLAVFYNVPVTMPFNMLHQHFFLNYENLNLKNLNLNFQHAYYTFLMCDKIIKTKTFFRLVFIYLIKVDKNFKNAVIVFKQILIEKMEIYNLVNPTTPVTNTTSLLTDREIKILFVVLFLHCTIQNFLTTKLFEKNSHFNVPLAFVLNKVGFFINFNKNDLQSIFKEILFKEKVIIDRRKAQKELKTKISKNRRLFLIEKIKRLNNEIKNEKNNTRIASNMRSRFSNYALVFFHYQYHYGIQGNFFNELLFGLKLQFLYLSVQRTYYYPLLVLMLRLEKTIGQSTSLKGEVRSVGLTDEVLRQLPLPGLNNSFVNFTNLNDLNSYLQDPNSGFGCWKRSEKDFILLFEKKGLSSLGLPEINLADLIQINKNLKQKFPNLGQNFNLLSLASLNFECWLSDENSDIIYEFNNIFNVRFNSSTANLALRTPTKVNWDFFAKKFQISLSKKLENSNSNLEEILKTFAFDLNISKNALSQSFVFFALICFGTAQGKELAFLQKNWRNIKQTQKLKPYVFFEAYLMGESFFWSIALLNYMQIHNSANQVSTKLGGFKKMYRKLFYKNIN